MVLKKIKFYSQLLVKSTFKNKKNKIIVELLGNRSIKNPRSKSIFWVIRLGSGLTKLSRFCIIRYSNLYYAHFFSLLLFYFFTLLGTPIYII